MNASSIGPQGCFRHGRLPPPRAGSLRHGPWPAQACPPGIKRSQHRRGGLVAGAVGAAAWLGAVLVHVGTAGAQSPTAAAAPVWRPPAAAAVQSQALAWLDQRKVDAATRGKALELWQTPPQEPAEVLDRLVRTFALVDGDVRGLVEFCSRPRGNAVPPLPSWLASPSSAEPIVTNNVRLWYARWLVHEELFDEAAEVLRGLSPQDVVDPASLLFYQGVVHHRLVQGDAARQALSALLAGGPAPQRYLAVARLMDADLKDLKEDTLDHIARRMADIERRLGLGRAGPKVRKIEDGVIESLDKLIKRLEAQQQQASSSGGANNIQSMRPAQDSQIMEGKGKGDVDRKPVGSQAGWGNLPPRQREEALQQIGRDFPSHYREIVEQYFRKLASESNP